MGSITGPRPPKLTDAEIGRPRVDYQYGTWCAVFGAVAVASLIWLWSLTAADFNPPNWIRIFGVAWLPIGVTGSLVTGILGRRGPDRVGVVIGLVLTALALIGFVVLIWTAEY
jgi:hypothetical protein